ncbi:MAG: hypothetical protein O3C67_08905 [Cyanobacteria bacterium]|nr:hypothetical protein [Cyanobacteriota bacterium]
MTDPGAQLYQLLAESNTRSRHCLQMGKAAASTLDRRHQQMLVEIGQLRQKIAGQGLGADPASEDRYLELLRDFRSLHQSHALSQQLPEMSEPPMGEELAKAVRYGRLLLEVYRPGILVKQASADISSHINALRRFEHPQANALATKLATLL